MTSNPSKVRVRFAPSPTGTLHIGGARTALYNYLFAKKMGGTFILRIEDTDLERSTPESIQAILDGMKWLGLNWDEGPYFQTKRFDLYNEHIERLIQEGKAYPCFCTAEDLDKKRGAAQAAKIKYKYDRTCWRLSPEERAQKLAAKIPHTTRFFSSDTDIIHINDVIKGDVQVDGKELDDLILRRTDGSPTYNLTVVIDDATMDITHVIRGDDHLNNTPRQIQLYRALGYPLPIFAHLPMILGTDKKKLSKRTGTTSVMAYRDMGYLPHALLNYLVKLGWSYKDQEIFSLTQMSESFTLEACSPSSGILNLDKLDWLNGHYIRESKAEDLAPLVKEILEKMGAKNIDEALLVKSVHVSLAKVKTLKEMAEFIDFLFMDVPAETDTIAKNITETAKPILKHICEEMIKAKTTDKDALHMVFEKIAGEFNVGMGKVANPVRVALSQKRISPGVYELIEIFGVAESVKKIERFL